MILIRLISIDLSSFVTEVALSKSEFWRPNNSQPYFPEQRKKSRQILYQRLEKLREYYCNKYTDVGLNMSTIEFAFEQFDAVLDFVNIENNLSFFPINIIASHVEDIINWPWTNYDKKAAILSFFLMGNVTSFHVFKKLI